MLRSMFTGISGLRNHQARMDVVANNISNINTVGFKRGRVNFQDILNQTISGAGAPTSDIGGTNPQQVGLGMTVASIETLFTQGNLQLTGINTDMAIQGDGMFMLRDADNVMHYTRAGTFTLDSNGTLVNTSNGYKVQGWQADSSGVVNPSDLVSEIIVPTGSTVAPQATTAIEFANNLDATTYGAVAWNTQTQIVDDGAGNTATLTWTFTPTGNFNEWTATGTLANGTWTSSGGNTISYTFNVDNDGTHPLGGSVGEVFAVGATSPGATDIVNVGGGGPVTLNLIDVGDILDGTLDEIDVVGVGSVDVDVGGTFAAAATHSTSINVYDSLGDTHAVTVTFTHVNYDPSAIPVAHTGNNLWAWSASGSDVTSGDGWIGFNTQGTTPTPIVNNALRLSVPPAVSPLDINTIDFSNVTQYAGDSTLIAAYQEGSEAGFLNTCTVGASGIVTGIYTNGITQNLAQVGLSSFVNPGGLMKEGENMFLETVNSGLPRVGTAETGGRGSISPGTLEMSNVDIAQEFVDMITAQRGFQVNSRSITTSDEILQEALNLKR